jgi:small-conductance mechanosensitive channel
MFRILALLLVGTFPTSALSQDDAAPEPPVETPIERAEVVIDGETLFNLAGTSAYPAEERAATTVERLIKAAEAAPGEQTIVEVRQEEFGPAIYANGVIIVIVTETDANSEGFPQDVVAATYQAAIEAALIAYHSGRSEEGIAKGTTHALLWTIAFGLLTFGLYAVRRVVRRRLERRINAWVTKIEEKSGRIIQAKSLVDAVTLLIRGFIITIYLLVFYYYITLILNSFAYTRTYGVLLLDIIAAPLIGLAIAAVGEIPDLITMVVIIILTRYFLKLVRLFFENIENGLIKIQNFNPAWTWPTYRIVRVLFILAAIVVAYPFIPGSGTDAFKGMTILLGVLFSFGSSSVVANLLSGLFVIYRRSVNIGDRVQIGALIGEVESVSLLETQLRSDFNELISIPNATMLNSELTNFSRTGATPGLIVNTVVGIGYDEPQERIAQLLIQAAKKTTGVKARPEPRVLRLSLNSFDISYRVNAHAKPGQDLVKLASDLNENVVDTLHGAGVQIMTPAYMADPVDAKIPS